MVFKEGCEALTQPFFGPVLRTDQQAEPGVTHLVRQLYVHTTVVNQNRLGQENLTGAEKHNM